ncbi:hypothetical protein T310_8685 [Rasamsonia emersonii CBS 393.64]|uniref:Uncharacterized protein n=1 Tax=Rasamsonia emersonii (strain ATCC 16479 / CBS 393.64 / IMI 116815) TaxID=1408163 RepID=A0A0F4YGQ4_RASE3|nr:hypothetical protein T310_8685 [Rasamsonia emersonii CBS 393.64]KKA17427.1 hypothetical protein T310_8685 [Rasamsonia emersonii CBS 393.64]
MHLLDLNIGRPDQTTRRGCHLLCLYIYKYPCSPASSVLVIISAIVPPQRHPDSRSLLAQSSPRLTQSDRSYRPWRLRLPHQISLSTAWPRPMASRSPFF